MVAVITSISPAGHGIFKPISTTSHDPVQNSRLRGLRGMAKPLKKSAPQGSHPLDPTRDRPREYFMWDLRTGAIAPVAGPDRHERAKITCDRLRLDADRLRIDRLERIENIISFLDDVLEEDPVSESTKNNLRRSLSVELSYLGAIDYLFHVSNPYSAWVDAARKKLPEIDDWLRPWA